MHSSGLIANLRNLRVMRLPRSSTRILAPAMAVLALVATTACQEPPSYRMRWSIDGRQMLDTSSCSESGLLEVRARAFDASGLLADERVYPCFPAAFEDPDGMVDGSALAPGRYAIELRGIDRTGDVWDEEASSFEPDGADRPPDAACLPDAEVLGCRPGELVCACEALTVVEQADPVDLPELVLMAPPQCIDGIDNDQDGMVDGADPSCAVDFGDGTEGVPVGVTELRLSLSLLGGNPAASCSGVPLRRLELSYVDDTGTEQVLEEIFEEPCKLDAPYLASLRLPAGTATFSAVGVDGAGQPVTVAKTFEAQISPTGGSVIEGLDFGPDDFLEPIVREIRARLGFESELGTEAAIRYSCDPPGQAGITRGTLALGQVRVSLLNGHGSPLGTPVTLEDGTVLDGATTLDCIDELVTEKLQWGAFQLEVEALSPEGEVCFSNVGAASFVGPGAMSTVLVPRVYGADGSVPASCHDCETDADCGLDTLACMGNVCHSRCMDEADCSSDVLGDIGAVCTVVETIDLTDIAYCEVPTE